MSSEGSNVVQGDLTKATLNYDASADTTATATRRFLEATATSYKHVKGEAVTNNDVSIYASSALIPTTHKAVVAGDSIQLAT